MSALTPEPDADPSRARTKGELGAALRALSQRKGLSLGDIERKTEGWTGPRQPLRTSTLSNAFTGKTLIREQALTSLLAVCGEPQHLHQRWLDARARIKARERGTAQRLVGADRFDTASPRDLGIHSAIVAPDATDDLPAYVERDFDFRLRAALVGEGSGRGCFVILVGGSSSGKTRSLYEAVHEVAPNWRLVQPAETEELLGLKDYPPSRTIFWLDELQRYLGSRPPLSSQCVRALTRRQNIVVGTLWPDQYARVVPRQPDTDEAGDIRRLLRSAIVISVADDFTAEELERAHGKAAQDTRIRMALQTRDAGLTQALAGGPALVLCWEQAPNPYTKAMITAAADAHRLGVQSPLSEEILASAMVGYLKAAQRVKPKEEWLAVAIPPATRPLHGDVSALSPADGGQPGTLAGYMVADYLAQHLRRRRRVECVPHEAWQTLVTRIAHSADLRRLADSAAARLRYIYAEMALERLVDEFADGGAVIDLAQLLIRQDRFERAVAVLHRRLEVDPRDRATARQLARTQELWQRVEEIRPAAAVDPASYERLTDVLTDGGVCDDLRRRAAEGDAVAGEELVERLAGRGCLRELRARADRGHVYAAEALADLYVARGDVELLQARARAGDRAADLRLSKVHAAGVRSAAAESEVAELRAAAGGDPEAARQLCTLLFELRDSDGLRAELEAGTYGAADRLIALYTADESMPPEQLAHLRAFGLAADGAPITPDSQSMTFGKDLRWPTT